MRKVAWLISIVLLILTSFFWIHPVFGQEAEGSDSSSEEKDEIPQHSEIALHAGTLLPNGIPGVRDSYPIWGMRFTHPFQIWHVEYWLSSANAKGVTFYQASLALRLDWKLNELTNFIFYLGPDLTLYKRSPTIVWSTDFSQQLDVIYYEYNSLLGGHGGIALVSPISSLVHLRGDCKMSFNPGATLMAALSLVFVFDGEEKKEGGQSPPP